MHANLLPSLAVAMPRHFNTAGPCRADKHYMLSPLRRLPHLRELIDDESYFVIHAPRQIGKTTAPQGRAKMGGFLAPPQLSVFLLLAELASRHLQETVSARQERTAGPETK